jgi:hypothetical protein
MKTKSIAIALSCLLLTASAAHAVVLSFENFAPAGSLIGVNPSSPYNESGFTIITKNSNSDVFDSAWTGLKMTGDPTDWFGLTANNFFALNLTSPPGRFNLDSLLVGPGVLPNAPVPPILNVTFGGSQFGGGTLTSTFTGLTTATLVTLNWTDLTSFGIVDFNAAFVGVDDIDVDPVPEPSSICILFSGIIGIALLSTILIRHYPNVQDLRNNPRDFIDA